MIPESTLVNRIWIWCFIVLSGSGLGKGSSIWFNDSTHQDQMIPLDFSLQSLQWICPWRNWQCESGSWPIHDDGGNYKFLDITKLQFFMQLYIGWDWRQCLQHLEIQFWISCIYNTKNCNWQIFWSGLQFSGRSIIG